MALQIKTRLFLYLQHLLPQHLLSRILGCVANCTWRWVKQPLIHLFIKVYKIDLSTIKNKDLVSYSSFNAFFTRELDFTFPVAPEQLLSPAEGFLSEFDGITDGQLLQAKGHSYELQALLAGDDALSANFAQGTFATIYLAPFNYHRVHLPVAGTLEELIYVPGKLYSVNLTTTHHVPELFAKNERLIMIFNTAHGKLAVILVGAMLVAGIVNPFVSFSSLEKKSLQKRDLRDLQLHLPQGAELGYFEFGSTVIMLLENSNFKFTFDQSCALSLGAKIGEW